MLTRLNLRLRVFLFFCLLLAGSTLFFAASLYWSWARAETDFPPSAFINAFLVSMLLNALLVTIVWQLFDEHVAKPIVRLAVELRLTAHSDVAKTIDEGIGRYLDDLGPAVKAVSVTLNEHLVETAGHVARETEKLRAEKEELARLLTETPVATILINANHEIVLYDGQAASLLSRFAPPRLSAPITDYFDAANIVAACSDAANASSEVTFALRPVATDDAYPAKIKSLDANAYLISFDLPAPLRGEAASRPLVFDFDGMNANSSGALLETPVSRACCVVFDSETTGLSTKTDELIQIGAVRIVNGRIVEGEVFNTLINSGKPIPPGSSRIHRIFDADVKGAPHTAEALASFHHFAKDTVIVAHNAPFDLSFLRRHEIDMGLRWDHPVLDTVLLSAMVFGISDDHSLDALCDRLGFVIPEGDRHTALGDARATARAFTHLIPLIEAKGFTSVGSVIEEAKKYGRLLADVN